MIITNVHTNKTFFVNKHTLCRIVGLREWVRVWVIEGDDDIPYIRVHERDSFGETIYLKTTKENIEVINR